jgi:acyl-CoA hydrolase
MSCLHNSVCINILIILPICHPDHRKCPCPLLYLSLLRRYNTESSRKISLLRQGDIMADKRITDSLTEQIHILRYEDINGSGRLFGGTLVSWIDEVAVAVAIRHCGTQVTTASIDNLQFKEAAYLGDLLVIVGRITYVGRTSMEVRVDSYIEKSDGTRHPINRAFLTLVSIGTDDTPIPVESKLILSNSAEETEWENAKKRVELRKQRRREGF